MGRSINTCIFLNGIPPRLDDIAKHCNPEDFIICTDGAYDYLSGFNITPNILIGDMDSISHLPDNQNITIISSSDQNTNDLEKTLQYCVEKHLKKLRIFGTDGKRFDHFMINIATLACYASELDIELFTHEEYARFLPPGNYRFSGIQGQRFSLLALKRAGNLTLEGAVHPMRQDVLETCSRGLSNAFAAAELKITFDAGLLLYMAEIK
ncbi:MAG: thiamine diphosphokinase [Candidatus Marinimicrobia bacterium]|nr:thiamine diphosphokinase [Candidatus Neomarinimicrobiota bacterium]